MKKILLGTTAGLAGGILWSWIGIAHGADLPTKAYPQAAPLAWSWSGIYIDGFGLYGANITNAVTAGDGFNTDLSSIPRGPGFGGDLMALTQLNQFVVGIRASAAYANLSATATESNGLTISNATNYLGDLNAIVGLPLGPDGRLLGYLTGGFAFGGAKPNLAVGTIAAGINDTSVGWDIGAGLRYALTPNWSLGIEGEYFRLGDRALTLSDPATGLPILTSNAKYDILVQKIVLGYKF